MPECQTIVTPAPRRGVCNIMVDLGTLMFLNQHPGLIPGWGPVIADVARKLALDTDPEAPHALAVRHRRRPRPTPRTSRNPPPTRHHRTELHQNPRPDLPTPRLPTTRLRLRRRPLHRLRPRRHLTTHQHRHACAKSTTSSNTATDITYEIGVNGMVFWRYPDGRTYVVPPHGLPWYIGDDLDNTPPHQPTDQIIPRTRITPDDQPIRLNG